MRYNAFFGELPINAFKPIGGRMTLEGGGNPFSAVTNAIEDVAGGVGNVVEGAVNTVEDLGAGLDRTVRDVLPGGWTTAALLAAGYYYQPEIQAFMNAQGATVPVAEVADAGVGGLQTGTAFTGELPAGYAGYTAPEVSTLGSVAGPTTGMSSGTALADVGAGDALSGIDLGGVGGSPNSLSLGGTYNAVPLAMNSVVPAAAGSTLSGMLPYMIGGQAATGLLQANAAKQAADIQSAAAQSGTALQGQMFNTINQQQAPYRTAGYGALNQIGGLGGGQYTTYDAAGNPTGTAQGSGYLTKQFDASDLQKGLAPNYDFMLQQGQMANQRAANMGGGALGGNALQGLNRYTQDYAGNAYQNAFTNYQNQRSNIYNTLAGIAGIGQTGQSATNQAAANATNAATSLGIGSAAAQAAGQVGSTNALANTVGNVGNTYMLSQLLNQSGRVAP
jgi:hypothetical protein